MVVQIHTSPIHMSFIYSPNIGIVAEEHHPYPHLPIHNSHSPYVLREKATMAYLVPTFIFY